MKTLVLAGGRAKRLWPLTHPKPLHPLAPGHTLLDQTLARLHNPYIISHLPLPYPNLILEPTPKGTAGALIYALHHLNPHPDEPILLLPSDQHFTHWSAVEAAITASLPLAATHIVLFGIPPHTPNPQLGYILPTTPPTFHEKPPNPAPLISQGALWNSGLALFTPRLLLQELRAHAPIYAHWLDNPTPFSHLPEASLDHALWQKTQKLALIPLDTQFTDLGTWETLTAHTHPTPQPHIQTLDCTNCHIQSQIPVIAIDLADLIIIQTEQGLLISKRGSSHRLKELT